MKRLALLIALVCSLPLMAKVRHLPATFDYRKGIEVAEVYQKPLLLAFLASDDCIWSERFIEEVLENQEFYQDIGKQFVFAIADFPNFNRQSLEQIETNHQIKKHFEVTSFPTFILLNAEGEEITRLSFPMKGHSEFGNKLKFLYDEYLSLCRDMHRDADVKELYMRALSLNTPYLVKELLEKGLQTKDNGYFLVEHYVQFAKEGRRECQEARRLRRQILKLKGDELAQAKLRLAICDFQALHHSKPHVAVGMIYRLIDHGKLAEQDQIKLNHLLANHFLEARDFLTAMRFAKKMKDSNSLLNRKSGEALISAIEQMADMDHKELQNPKPLL